MTSLIGKFQRDLPFLSQNQIPLTESGQKINILDYKGEQDEKLTDNDVQTLSQALLNNSNFQGPLDLSDNNLTDLVKNKDLNFLQSALYIADVIAKKDGTNITELNLSKTYMQAKAGIYIGDALISSPNYPIQQILFRNISLGEDGLYRLMEGANQNQNIQRLHVGILSDSGLKLLSERLALNQGGLLKLEFQEDEKSPWTEDAKRIFLDRLKESTELESVRFVGASGEEENVEKHHLFKQEIDFYTNKKLTVHKKLKRIEKRQEECNPENMFHNILALIETKEQQKRMPVRKFFNNTFGTILNDAIFALKKKQSKEQNNELIFTKKGSVKFVAMYLLENLPQHEKEPDLYDSSDSKDDL